MIQDKSDTEDFRLLRIWARNFRSIAYAELEIDALTVLVGPNASGKSNTMDIIRFIKDSLWFNLETAIALRHGLNMIRRRRPEGEDLLSDIEIGVEAVVRRYQVQYSFVIKEDPDIGFHIEAEHFLVKGDGDEIDLSMKRGRAESRALSLHDCPNCGPQHTDDSLKNNFMLSTIYSVVQYDPDDQERDRKRLLIMALRSLHDHLKDMHCYHIFPNMIREPQRPGNLYPLDESGINLASVLGNLEKRDPGIIEAFRKSISHLVPGISDVRVRSIGGFQVVEFGHIGASTDENTWFDLSQESDGTLRLLGVLTALYQDPSPAFIGIEEPEFAIHPGALTGLAEVLAESSEMSQIMVTTHSPDLIDQIPVDNLRVVDANEGVTTIGKVSHGQVQAIRRQLFSPGELHRTEGLRRAEGIR